jgi:hypothetical protein
VASSLSSFRNGAVGFIDGLDGFIDMQAHVLNAFATAVSNAVGYAMHRSRSHDAVIRVYDECAEKL